MPTVSYLSSVPKYKNKELQFHALLNEEAPEVELVLV
jgi:hypothetical protein